MKGDRIPSQHHVSRYCTKKGLSEESGMPTGAAFMIRRDRGETYLSVNWLEFFAVLNKDQQVHEVRTIFAAKMKGGIGAQAKFCIARVRDIEQCFPSSADEIKVLHEPEPFDPSHAGIFGFDSNEGDMLLAVALSRLNWEMVPARVSAA
jgi:hypothetical protein